MMLILPNFPNALEKLNTPRLAFRLLTMADKTLWSELFEEAQVNTFLGMPTDISHDEKANRWWARNLERSEKQEGGMVAIIRRDDGVFLGQTGLLVQEVDGIRELEIGYTLLKDYRGLGYATEAVNALRVYAFQNKLAESIISIIHVDNEPSKAVARRNGMTLEKTTTFKSSPVAIFRVWNR